MAENEDGQEKTEQPTGKRIRESRQKGQVPRSRELNTVIELVTAGSVLLMFGGYFGLRISAELAAALDLERAMLFDSSRLPEALLDQLMSALITLAPLFAVLAVGALIGPMLVGGGNFSTEALMPKFSKLNVLEGIKRLFSPTGLVELVKALGKFIVVSTVAVWVLAGLVKELLALGEEPIRQAIMHTAYLAVWTFLMVSLALIVVALIDVPFQLWNHNKQLRMTQQEVKDENKETEGKPEVKNRIRRLQYEMAQRRMMAEVPKADVIITNPTHFAVALAYRTETMRAPRLLAKGTDEVAAAIRALAEDHGIARIEAPRVARAIYYTTDLNQEIPAGLFVAVARILAYVYQLKRHDERVRMPTELPVPEAFLDPNGARRARHHSL